MQVVYAREDIPESVTQSIFLVGPTPRSDDGAPWRADAVQLLQDMGFEGVVYVPEPRDGVWIKDYDGQVEWEELCLNQADCIVAWVPRDLETMPAFTTNIEWGRWESSGKMVLGYPDDAPKMSYMNHYAKKLNIPVNHTLEKTLRSAMDFVAEGAERTGGSRMVPLYVWNTPSFQAWHKAQTDAGNRLDDARVLYNFRPGNKKFMFLWVLHVDVFVKSEDRHKVNEFVLSRTDISSVLMWHRREPLSESDIVLVREFRSPASTVDGFIWELPGGSAMSKLPPAEVAAEEIHEETGLHLETDRLQFHGARQLAGTLSAHKAHSYSVDLTEEELDFLKAQKGVAHGLIADSEQTYVEVVKLNDILYGDVPVDWTTLGMIMLITDKL